MSNLRRIEAQLIKFWFSGILCVILSKAVFHLLQEKQKSPLCTGVLHYFCSWKGFIFFNPASAAVSEGSGFGCSKQVTEWDVYYSYLCGQQLKADLKPLLYPTPRALSSHDSWILFSMMDL